MRGRSYGLGIDVGDSTVVAAVCPPDDDGRPGEARLLPLGRGTAEGSAALAVVGGRLSVLPPPGPGPAGGLVEHVLQRVGAPTPLVGAGRGLSAAAAVAAIAARAHEVAARSEGHPAAWTVLTVPPSWGGHRRDLLAAALVAAGLPRSSVVSSAVAVVRACAGALPAGSTVAVYDLGAGSLDTAVLRTTDDGDAEQLAVPPAPLAWGGRDLDDAVVGHVVGSLPGGAAPTHPAERAALRRACVAAKEALSTETDVRVDVQVDGTPCTVRLVREDVEDLVADAVEDSVDVLRQALAAAGRTVEDLAAVVLAGGGTRVPLVAETLSAELGRPLVTDGEPALTAARGAAQLALARAAEPAAEAAPADAAEPAAAPAAEPAEEGAEEGAEEPAVLPLPVGRRPRRPRSTAGADDRATTRRHLQRAAVLTTAVLALWAGSASLVAVVDPAGGGAPLGGSTAEADGEPTPGRAPAGGAAAETDGDVAAGPLTPAAHERARTDAETGDDATPSSAAAPGTATRAATGKVSGPASAPGTPSSSATPGATTVAPPTVPSTGPGTQPGGSTGTGSPSGPVSTPPEPAPTSDPPAEPDPEPSQEPHPEPEPEPEPSTDPEPSQEPDPQPGPTDPPAPTTTPADGTAAGQPA